MRHRLVGAVALAAAAFATPHAADAAGGNSGKIYYEYAGSIWVMNHDGTGKTVLPVSDEGTAEPSHALHEGKRWFLRPEGAYGGGRGLFAVREDGAVKVQLLADPTLDVDNDVSWARDDSFVSCDAVDHAAPGGPVGRVLRLAVSFDASGTPAAAAPPDPVVQSTASSVGGSPVQTRVFGIDWSPSGDRLAWGESTSSGYSLRVTTLSTGSTATIATGNGPRWSPSGARILFVVSAFKIASVDPSGANLKDVIVEKSSSGYGVGGIVDWSPDGDAVLYRRDKRTGFPLQRDVWRATSAGKTKKELTADVSGQAFPLAWR
jgi:hypothetical protein